jgi:hypothetical protein
MLIGREPLTPMERLQEAVERMYEREDEALRERIAAERFETHEWSEQCKSPSSHSITGPAITESPEPDVATGAKCPGGQQRERK